MDYWSNRNERKAHAVSHTAIMAQKYRKEIKTCVDSIVVYKDTVAVPESCRGVSDRCIEFKQCGTVEAIKLYAGDGKMCILDFASYTHPGGKFLEGSCAQEECLCHESFLYNVLKTSDVKSWFYRQHAGTPNSCLYSSHLLYLPNVRFCDSIDCDVMVCAAPNKKAAMRYYYVADFTVDKYMRERCRIVIEAAAHQKVHTLILGAFGCGVFGNDPRVVAKEFKRLLVEEYPDCFSHVVFAVPDEANGQYFEAEFGS